MMDSSSDRNPIEVLAEEFAERQRRGEPITIEAFAAGHPEHADDIRDLFPALVKIEAIRPRSGDVTGPIDGAAGPARLERLGDYRILREVGRGGMGVVYEAEQESLGRHVALKVLPVSALLDAKHVDRFVREAKSAARLHHTNIVPVYGVGQQDGLHYYVMQFIQGLGLDQVLTELRALHRHPGGAVPPEFSARSVARALLSGNQSGAPPERPPTSDTASGPTPLTDASQTGRAYWQSVARLGMQVAQAMAHAHSQGTLHRDIKPSNLLLDAHGNVWVTDFGLAKAADGGDLTSTGEVVGTLRYIPPERFQGQSDARGDVYALGLTLYELLTFRPAFEDSERHRLIERILHDDPPAPRKLNPSVPRDLETIVLKAISRDPHQRYASASALAEDLERFLEDRPIRARRVSARERFWRWCKRNPSLASATGLAALGLLAVAVVALLFARAQARFAREQTESAGELRRHQEKLLGEQKAGAALTKRLSSAFTDLKKESARMAGERAQSLLEQQEVPQAALWLARALALAPAEDVAGRRGYRASLAALARDLPVLRAVIPAKRNATASFSADGKTILVVSQTLSPLTREQIEAQRKRSGERPGSPPGGFIRWGFRRRIEAQLWSAATGRAVGPVVRIEPQLSEGSFPFSTAASGAPALAPDGKTLLVPSGKDVLLIDGLSGRQLGKPLTLPGVVYQALFRPDGKAFLTVYRANASLELRLWDTVTREPAGVPFRTPAITSARVEVVAPLISGLRPVFRPDGKALLTGFLGRTTRARQGLQPEQALILWDPVSGRQLGKLETPRSWSFVREADFSGDGKRIRTLSLFTYSGQKEGNYRCQWWDAATGKPLGASVEFRPLVSAVRGRSFLRPGTTFFFGANLGADGRTVLALGGREARLWDTHTGTAFSAPLPVAGSVNSGALSPDGQFVLLTGSDDRTGQTEVRLWQLPTSRLIRMFPGPTQSTGRSFGSFGRGGSGTGRFSPDGKWVLAPMPFLTRAAPDLRLFDTASGRQVRLEVLAGSSRTTGGTTRLSVLDACFAEDGKTLQALVISPLGSGGEIHAWDLRTGKARRSPVAFPLPGRGFGGGRGLGRAWFAPDGKTFLTAGTKPRLLDSTTGRVLAELPHPGNVTVAAFHPAGRIVLLASSSVRRPPWLEPAPKPATPPSTRTSGEVRLWDLVELEPIGRPLPALLLGGPAAAVLAAAFSPDGKTFYTLERSARVRLWDGRTGKPLGPVLPTGGQVSRAIYSPDGRRLATVSENEVQVWDVARLEPVGEVMQHAQVVLAACFSPDGETVLTGSGDRTARLWNARTGRPIGLPMTHIDAVCGVAFRPDGRALLTDCEDGVQRLWEFCLPARATGPVADRLAALLGMELTAEGAVQHLDGATWRKRVRAVPAQLARPAEDAMPWHLHETFRWFNLADGDRVRWHLERQLRLDPDDWLARLQRARIRAHEDGDPAAATADVRRALARGTPGAVLPWLERYETFQGYRDKPAMHAWLIERILEIDKTNTGLLSTLANKYAEQGDYRRSLDVYRRLTSAAPTFHWSWYQRATLHLYLDDRAGFRAACRKLIALSGKDAPEINAERTAKVSLLTADPEGGIPLMLQLTERVIRAVEKANDSGSAFPTAPLALRRAAYRTTRGMAEYRAGRPKEAIAWLKKNLKNRNAWVEPLGQCFLALAYHKVGQAEEAKKALAAAESAAQKEREAKARRSGGIRASSWAWYDMLQYEVAHREAVKVVRGLKEKKTP
jgi:serine/threonine protein kinase/WD40 repeat protein